MFNGSTIIFDGIPSEEFGLMLVGRLNNKEQGGGLLGPGISIVEDTISRSQIPIYYGSTQTKPLEFSLVLSVMDDGRTLSRHDLSYIAGWLYGHQGHKELVVCQKDLADYFYKCQVTEIEPIFIAGNAVGISINIICDSPHAYMRTPHDKAVCQGSLSHVYHNRSNMNGYYRPSIVFDLQGEASVVNSTTGGAELLFRNIPAGGAVIHMDCARQIVTCQQLANPYEHFNLVFPAFVRGSNKLQISGKIGMTIINEFPMYIGA